jgi:hypothetical protein
LPSSARVPRIEAGSGLSTGRWPAVLFYFHVK